MLMLYFYTLKVLLVNSENQWEYLDKLLQYSSEDNLCNKPSLFGMQLILGLSGFHTTFSLCSLPLQRSLGISWNLWTVSVSCFQRGKPVNLQGYTLNI